MALAMEPRRRRNLAAIHVGVSVAAGAPLSWWLPTIDPVWFQRVVLALSFYAITTTAADIWATTDVRTAQDADA
jgi:hypothetical protein